jgi:quinoprotein dehydrogenase-associated probable ABC transporter substrate-binding protein
MRNHTSVLIPALSLVLAPLAAQADVLRVCSDPNNLPFSNRSGQGFENKIADLVALDLGDHLEYTFAAQHKTFIKRTLNAHKCDVLMGVPTGMDDVDETQPYYASTYVFVYRKEGNFRLTSLKDPRLHKLKIGVHLIDGDDAPPELALGQEGIVDNVSGFMIYGNYAKPNPPARLIEAVEKRNIDIAAAWGPLGGYFAKHSPVALTVAPITDFAQFKPLVFRYAIAMGVRKGDSALRDQLDGVIEREQPAIRNILQSYGVPLVGLKGGSHG